MEFLKELFGTGSLTWEQFSQAVADKDCKIANLSDGGYVSKQKYEHDLGVKDKQIETLNSALQTRDTDLENLQEQLKGAGADKEEMQKLSNQLTELQQEYETTKTNYEKELTAAKYDFAVKEFADKQNFTSQAAKRDFISHLKEKNLQMENDTILGAADYLDKYKQDNADSFMSESPNPQFAGKTSNYEAASEKGNPFAGAMNFFGVRPEK